MSRSGGAPPSGLIDAPVPAHPKGKTFRAPKAMKRIPKRKPDSSQPPGFTQKKKSKANRIMKIPKISKRNGPPSSTSQPRAQKSTPISCIRAADVHRKKQNAQRFKQGTSSPKRLKKNPLPPIQPRPRPRVNPFFGSLMQPKYINSSLVAKKDDSQRKRLKKKNSMPISSSSVHSPISRKRLLDSDTSPMTKKIKKKSFCRGPSCSKKVTTWQKFCSPSCKSEFDRIELNSVFKAKQESKPKMFVNNADLKVKEALKKKRMNSRKVLEGMVKPEIAKKIEKRLHKQYDGLKKDYFAKLRELVQNLRCNKMLQDRLNDKSLHVKRFLKMNSEEMASEELSKEREDNNREFDQYRVTKEKIVGLGAKENLLSNRSDVLYGDQDLEEDDDLGTPRALVQDGTMDFDRSSSSSDDDDEDDDLQIDITSSLPPKPTQPSSSSSSSGSNQKQEATYDVEDDDSFPSINIKNFDLDVSISSVEPPDEVTTFDEFLETEGGDEDQIVDVPIVKEVVSTEFSYDRSKPFPSMYEDSLPVWSGLMRDSKASRKFLSSLVQLSGDTVQEIQHVNQKGLLMNGEMDFLKIVESLAVKKDIPDKNKLHLFILQPLEGAKNTDGYDKFARYCRNKNRAIVFDLRKTHKNKTRSGMILYFMPPISSNEKELSKYMNTDSVESMLPVEFLAELFGDGVERPQDLVWCIGVTYIPKNGEVTDRKKSGK